MEQKLRIIFMGTPEFAVPSLDILLENNYEIVAVITSPDKPAGRGQKVQEAAVKKFARIHGLRILQPEKLKDPVFIDNLKQLHPDLQVVVAFRMLPAQVWDLPASGTINLHASLLPNYRGAAPINWAIINGEKETGLTTFFLQHEIDTGKIIFQERVEILDKDTAGDLHDRLMQKGAKLVLKTIRAIQLGKLSLVDQSSLINKHNDLRTAPKIFREHCQLNWSKSGNELHNLIRGLSPYPGAWCVLKAYDGQNLILKIYSSEFFAEKHEVLPGTLSTNAKSNLRIAVSDGWLNLLAVQLEGKKRMNIDEFLRGQPNIIKMSFLY